MRRRARSRSTAGGSPRSTPARPRRRRRASTCAGLTLPGPGQRALARLPPGAARAHPSAAAARSGPGASRCTPSPARSTPDSYFALARATYAEMALAGITCVGEFHYLHHGPDGAPLRRPERDGAGAGRRPPATPASGSRCSTPATSPAASAQPLEGAAAPLRRRRRRRAGRSGSPAATTADARPDRRGDPLGARRPGRPAAHVVAGGRERRAAARAPVRAARGERGLPGRLRPHARPQLLADARRARPAHHRRARHPPHRRRHRAARRRRHRRLHVPDHRARPGRRHRPGPALADAGAPLALGTRQPRGDRPVRGGARGRAGRAAGHASERGHFTAAELLAAATATGTRRSAGRTPAGSPPARAPTWSRSRLDSRAHRPAPAATALEPSCSPRPRPTCAHVVVDGRPVVADGRHASSTTRRRAARRGRDRWAQRCHVSTCSSTASASWSPTTRRSATAAARASCATPRWSSTAAGSPGSGPRAGAPGRRRSASTPAAARCIPGFVDCHAHLVFAGDRARGVRRPDGRAAATPPAASAPRSPRPAPRPTRSCARRLRPARRRGARSGHHDRRVQVRLRPDRRRRGAAAWRSPPSSPTRPPSSARTSCPPEYADDPTATSTLVTGADARRLRAARRAGSTSSASAAPSTPTRRARSCAPAWRRA